MVVLNTAPQHADTVRAAIAAGKDVYCEWPLTPSVDTSRELVRLAAAAGVRTIVGLQRRLAPHSRYLGDLLKQGFVGKLRSVRMHVTMNSFQAHRPSALAWTAPPETSPARSRSTPATSSTCCSRPQVGPTRRSASR